VSRCLHCGRPIPEGRVFCRRWWAQLSPEQRLMARTRSGLLRVVARQALACLDARSATPSEVAV